jgi:hypothetical protein
MSDSIKDKNLYVVNEILIFLVYDLATKQCEDLLFLYTGGRGRGQQVENVATAQSEQVFYTPF